VAFPFLISLILMVTDLGIAILMLALDKKAKDIDTKNNYPVHEEVEKVVFKDIFNFGKLFWIVNFGTFIAWGTLQYNNNIQ
jgi:hypothetical protein